MQYCVSDMLDVDRAFNNSLAVWLKGTFFSMAGDHLGLSVADIDLRAGDIEVSAIQGCRFGETGRSVFRSCIRDRHRSRCVSRYAAVIDYPATLGRLAFEYFESLSSEYEGAGKIHIDDLSEVLDGELVHRHGRRTDASVVEHGIDATKLLNRFLEYCSGKDFIGDVSRRDERFGRTFLGGSV